MNGFTRLPYRCRVPMQRDLESLSPAMPPKRLSIGFANRSSADHLLEASDMMEHEPHTTESITPKAGTQNSHLGCIQDQTLAHG